MMPSVFVTDTSARMRMVSVSVAVLLERLGSAYPAGGATVAELTRVPVAATLSVAVATKVAVPPASRFTLWLMLRRAGAAPQEEPAEAEHVQEAPVS